MQDQLPPPVLFKYRSTAPDSLPYTRAMLEKQELFMATRVMFNDPFECRPEYSYSCTKEQLRVFANRVLQKAPLTSAQRRARVAEIVRTRRDKLPVDFAGVVTQLNKEMDVKVGIYCLSARRDHLLMWSHYGSSHTGVCVGFDAESSDSPFRNARPVQYSRDYPVCRVFADDREEVQARATYTKADVWSYEEEWRLINYRDGASVKRFEPRLLVSITLGARIDKSLAEDVAAIARDKYPHAKLDRAVLTRSKYGLEFVAV